MKLRTTLYAGAVMLGSLACAYSGLQVNDTLTTMLDTHARHARVIQLGAEVGAVDAFAIACFVDCETVHRSLGNRRSISPLMQIKFTQAEHA